MAKSIKKSDSSYSIIRPTVSFGKEDILINNIAWLLRHFPVFPIFGSGTYQLQPMYVEDMADLVVQVGQSKENGIIDAVGPDIFTFEELVRLIAAKLSRSNVLFPHVNPGLAFQRLLELRAKEAANGADFLPTARVTVKDRISDLEGHDFATTNIPCMLRLAPFFITLPVV